MSGEGCRYPGVLCAAQSREQRVMYRKQIPACVTGSMRGVPVHSADSRGTARCACMSSGVPEGRLQLMSLTHLLNNQLAAASPW